MEMLKSVIDNLEGELRDDFLYEFTEKYITHLNSQVTKSIKRKLFTSFTLEDSGSYRLCSLLSIQEGKPTHSIFDTINILEDKKQEFIQQGIKEYLFLLEKESDMTNLIKKLTKSFTDKLIDKNDFLIDVMPTKTIGRLELTVSYVGKYDNKEILKEEVNVTNEYPLDSISRKIVNMYEKIVFKRIQFSVARIFGFAKYNNIKVHFLNSTNLFAFKKEGTKFELEISNSVLYSSELYNTLMERLNKDLSEYHKTELLNGFLQKIGAEDFIITKDITEKYNIEKKSISFDFDLTDKELKTKFIKDLRGVEYDS